MKTNKIKLASSINVKNIVKLFMYVVVLLFLNKGLEKIIIILKEKFQIKWKDGGAFFFGKQRQSHSFIILQLSTYKASAADGGFSSNHTNSPSNCLANFANECATELAPFLTHETENTLNSLPILLMSSYTCPYQTLDPK